MACINEDVCVRYPQARAITRRIIFHAGPTNSGKTYHALERYLAAKSGVYCGPLKLLASEVFKKANERVNVYINNRKCKCLFLVIRLHSSGGILIFCIL